MPGCSVNIGRVPCASLELKDEETFRKCVKLIFFILENLVNLKMESKSKRNIV